MLGVLQGVRLLEMCAVRELVGLQEVQEAPQLLNAVLEGRSRDQQLVLKSPLLQLLQSRSRAYISSGLV